MRREWRPARPFVSRQSATKADLHILVDDLPEERVETAKRFLESLRGTKDPESFLARFIETMDPAEAKLLDDLAELDRDQGPPAFVADEPDPRT